MCSFTTIRSVAPVINLQLELLAIVAAIGGSFYQSGFMGPIETGL